MREAWQLFFDAFFEQQLDAVTIHDVRAVDPCFQHKTLCIGEHMTFATGRLLATVKAALLTTDARRLTPTVSRSRRQKLARTTKMDTQLLAHDPVDAFPCAVCSPLVEVSLVKFSSCCIVVR